LSRCAGKMVRSCYPHGAGGHQAAAFRRQSEQRLARHRWRQPRRHQAANEPGRRVKAAATDQGVALVLELELEFGLRAEEGIRSVESLADWLRALTNPLSDGYVTIIHGTKGGKTRRSPPLDRERAADLVRRAIEFSRQHRGRLVRKQGMKKAMARYHYVTDKAGMTGENAPHSLRYWYTTEHLRRLKVAGIARREAAAAASTWLGHGDGRGTWVELVYGRKALNEAEV